MSSLFQLFTPVSAHQKEITDIADIYPFSDPTSFYLRVSDSPSVVVYRNQQELEDLLGEYYIPDMHLVVAGSLEGRIVRQDAEHTWHLVEFTLPLSRLVVDLYSSCSDSTLQISQHAAPSTVVACFTLPTSALITTKHFKLGNILRSIVEMLRGLDFARVISVCNAHLESGTLEPPHTVAFLCMRATALVGLSRRDEAAADVEAALAIDKRCLRGRLLNGSLRLMQGHTQEVWEELLSLEEAYTISQLRDSSLYRSLMGEVVGRRHALVSAGGAGAKASRVDVVAVKSLLETPCHTASKPREMKSYSLLLTQAVGEGELIFSERPIAFVTLPRNRAGTDPPCCAGCGTLLLPKKQVLREVEETVPALGPLLRRRLCGAHDEPFACPRACGNVFCCELCFWKADDAFHCVECTCGESPFRGVLAKLREKRGLLDEHLIGCTLLFSRLVAMAVSKQSKTARSPPIPLSKALDEIGVVLGIASSFNCTDALIVELADVLEQHLKETNLVSTEPLWSCMAECGTVRNLFAYCRTCTVLVSKSPIEAALHADCVPKHMYQQYSEVISKYAVRGAGIYPLVGIAEQWSHTMAMQTALDSAEAPTNFNLAALSFTEENAEHKGAATGAPNEFVALTDIFPNSAPGATPTGCVLFNNSVDPQEVFCHAAGYIASGGAVVIAKHP